MRALVISDGEHYAPVVRDALAALPYDVVALWLAGGGEKLRSGEDYGVPVVDSLEGAIAELEPEIVIDLSDEPVLGPRERLRVASRVLALGLPYAGPDFRFDPPTLAPFPLPSLSIVGTGKRVGKTAITGHIARLLALDREVVVVAMGRGGPPEPEVAEVEPTLERLLELSRGGLHAASDYLETAALAGVVTIGCRRCGGGLAGATGESNVLEGAALAAERSPELVIFDGSGAAIPPVETDARVLVTSVSQREVATEYLNAYRILVSDLVIVTGGLDEELVQAIHQVKELPVVSVELRPRPVAPVLGRRVAFFTTAPPDAHHAIERHLREELGAEVVLVSGNLARREALREDLARAREAEVYLVEIKAAAIDVVAEDALVRGVEVVFADNELVPVGVLDLDTELVRLADQAIAREAVAQ
jgi:cyclic 2,3-diphosphoglycerate synthetase